jgi:hypothetical protein
LYVIISHPEVEVVVNGAEVVLLVIVVVPEVVVVVVTLVAVEVVVTVVQPSVDQDFENVVAPFPEDVVALCVVIIFVAVEV